MTLGVAAADQFVDRVTGQPLDGLGREDDHSGSVEDDDRVGRVHEQTPKAILAVGERLRRDLAFVRAQPDDAIDEDEAGGHEHGDAVTAPGADDARRPAEGDCGLGRGEAGERPYGCGKDGGRTLDRDGLRGTEHEPDREHRTPARLVDHARDADHLQSDPEREW